MMYLREGGNVFKDAQGQPLTQRINQADIPATIAWVEQVTGIISPKIVGWVALVVNPHPATWTWQWILEKQPKNN